MSETILTDVTGASLKGAHAVLDGYSRHPVRGEDYPGMVPNPGQSVSGVVYRGLTPTMLRRLDRFEGAEYDRLRVTVLDASGLRVPAWTYVFRPEYRSMLLPGDWNFDDFLSRDLAHFRTRHLGN